MNLQTVRGPQGEQRMPAGLPAHAMKTYAIATPQRPATCEEYGCPRYLNGWVTIVPEGSEQAAVARSLRGRYAFTETPQPGGLVEFRFEPGQECWAQHRMPWDGRERFAERGGDWRGNPRGEVRELRPADWVDSFANHQIRLADRLERG